MNTANSHLEIVAVVAIADNGVIGRDNMIPWRMKQDMQRFKAMTIGKPVVMGRKTFLSFKRPLAGRTNIIMTRDKNFAVSGAVVTTSMDHARDVAVGDALRRNAREIAVIGGAEIYAQWMALIDRFEITEVHTSLDGDVSLPPLDRSVWEETARERHDAGPDDISAFSYVTYRRRAH